MVEVLWELMGKTVAVRRHLERQFENDFTPFDVGLSCRLDSVVIQQEDLAVEILLHLNGREAA